MVKMSGIYQGELHCEMTHGPSKSKISTDAPVDNHGKGQAFSPTDLLGASLGSCILTTMAIIAERDKVNLKGAEVFVEKEMASDAPRRVESLSVKLRLPSSIPVEYRPKLEAIAHSCPVHRSLRADIQIPVTYEYV